MARGIGEAPYTPSPTAWQRAGREPRSAERELPAHRRVPAGAGVDEVAGDLGVSIRPILDDVFAHLIAHRIGVPGCPAQQMLHAVRVFSPATP